MITKAFYKRWIGPDSEKDLIDELYPNQVRDSDLYFSEDNKEMFFRYNNIWWPINKKTTYDTVVPNIEEIKITLKHNECKLVSIDKKYSKIKDIQIFHTQENNFIDATIDDNILVIENLPEKYFVTGNVVMCNIKGNAWVDSIQDINTSNNITTITLKKCKEFPEDITNCTIKQMYTMVTFNSTVIVDGKSCDLAKDITIMNTNGTCAENNLLYSIFPGDNIFTAHVNSENISNLIINGKLFPLVATNEVIYLSVNKSYVIDESNDRKTIDIGSVHTIHINENINHSAEIYIHNNSCTERTFYIRYSAI